jgi:hypothetical protein
MELRASGGLKVPDFMDHIKALVAEFKTCVRCCAVICSQSSTYQATHFSLCRLKRISFTGLNLPLSEHDSIISLLLSLRLTSDSGGQAELPLGYRPHISQSVVVSDQYHLPVMHHHVRGQHEGIFSHSDSLQASSLSSWMPPSMAHTLSHPAFLDNDLVNLSAGIQGLSMASPDSFGDGFALVNVHNYGNSILSSGISPKLGLGQEARHKTATTYQEGCKLIKSDRISSLALQAMQGVHSAFCQIQELRLSRWASKVLHCINSGRDQSNLIFRSEPMMKQCEAGALHQLLGCADMRLQLDQFLDRHDTSNAPLTDVMQSFVFCVRGVLAIHTSVLGGLLMKPSAEGPLTLIDILFSTTAIRRQLHHLRHLCLVPRGDITDTVLLDSLYQGE